MSRNKLPEALRDILTEQEARDIQEGAPNTWKAIDGVLDGALDGVLVPSSSFDQAATESDLGELIQAAVNTALKANPEEAMSIFRILGAKKVAKLLARGKT